MTEESDLEKRAVEELLRETNRARLRAETMGPAGWMKCPLKSTNKRFLLNTLRSSGLSRRTPGQPLLPPRSRSRSRSRTPPRQRRDHTHRPRDASDHNRHERRHTNGQECSGRSHDARAKAHRLRSKEPSPSRSHSLLRERSRSPLAIGSLSPGHAHRPHGGGPRNRHGSPAEDKPSRRRGK